MIHPILLCKLKFMPYSAVACGGVKVPYAWYKKKYDKRILTYSLAVTALTEIIYN